MFYQQQPQNDHQHQQQQDQSSSQYRSSYGGMSDFYQSTNMSESSWPQSEFVTNVIEAPIDTVNPGWREKEVPSARSIRLRAEAGQASMSDSRPRPNTGSTSAHPREGRKTIPSHFQNMKYKGQDPDSPEQQSQLS